MTHPSPVYDRSTAAAPPAVWDGEALLAAIGAATEWLTANTDQINALNVFPVPDGDTGTNMRLTMRAAVTEAASADPKIQASAGEVAAKLAYGALMGARGNSGVILSQIFRGFARAIAEREEIDGRDFATALSGAREMAYKAVMRPVEGTMLTVIRVAAEHAEASAERTPALATVLAEAGRGAREALATTPDLLDILRQAGVVDAGGQGIVYILEGMERFARGEQVVTTPEVEATPLGAEMAFLDQVEELHGVGAFGYCTNFMVFGERMDFEQCRADIAAMGESAVIVGDDKVLKVHIHVLNPGKVLDYAVGLGQLGQIKIDNMQSQTDTLVDQREQAAASTLSNGSRLQTAEAEEPEVTGFGFAASTAPARSQATPSTPPVGRQAVLAVAAGEGLAEALRSMGATSIVAGGQTMNPSTEELLSAVEAAPADEVILLPNNPNILLTANQVPDLSAKKVRVVPSRSVPQGLAALASHNVDGDLDKNVTDMTRALRNVRTVELTCAVRDAVINGVDVRVGQVIGLLDDHLVASGDNATTVACKVLQEAGFEDAELVTIFTGEGAKPEGSERLRQTIEAHYPGIAVEVYAGGQPHYQYVIAIE